MTVYVSAIPNNCWNIEKEGNWKLAKVPGWPQGVWPVQSDEVLCVTSCSALTTLKFFILFEQGAYVCVLHWGVPHIFRLVLLWHIQTVGQEALWDHTKTHACSDLLVSREVLGSLCHPAIMTHCFKRATQFPKTCDVKVDTHTGIVWPNVQSVQFFQVEKTTVEGSVEMIMGLILGPNPASTQLKPEAGAGVLSMWNQDEVSTFNLKCSNLNQRFSTLAAH